MSEQTTSVGTEQTEGTAAQPASGEQAIDTSKVQLPEQYRASTLKDLPAEDRKARIAEMDVDMLELAHKNAGSSEWSAKGRYEKNQSGENHRTWAAYTAIKAELLEALKAKRAEGGKATRTRSASKNGAVTKISSAAERLNTVLIGFVSSDEFTAEAKASFLEGAVAYVTAAETKKPSEESETIAAARAELDKIENPVVREAMAKALGLLAVKVPESKPLPVWGKMPEPVAAETPKPSEPTEEVDPNAQQAQGTEPITGPTGASEIVAEHAAERAKGNK